MFCYIKIGSGGNTRNIIPQLEMQIYHTTTWQQENVAHILLAVSILKNGIFATQRVNTIQI